MYRLHPALHYLDCSEQRFARWSVTQRSIPVWVTTTRGVRWWWYLDRLWWDDERLRADEVRERVHDWDVEKNRQHTMSERARAEAFGRKRI
jgi:hypothetical protein